MPTRANGRSVVVGNVPADAVEDAGRRWRYGAAFAKDGDNHRYYHVSAAPLHYHDGREWQEYDTRVVAIDDPDFAYGVAAADRVVKFNASANSARLVRLEQGDAYLELVGDKLCHDRDDATESLSSRREQMNMLLRAQELMAPITGQDFVWLPCVEDNFPSSDAATIAGLNAWARTARRAVVITRPSRPELFESLADAAPGITIIPGLKTMDHFSDGANGYLRFDDMGCWSRIADSVSEFIARTGATRLMLESEEPFKLYWQADRYEIDWPRMAKCLRLLPPSVEYIWYPALPGDDNQQRERSLAMTLCVAANVRNVIYTDRSLASPGAIKSPWYSTARHSLLLAVANRPTMPMLYFYGSGSPFWQDEQALEAFGHVAEMWGPGIEVMIYPGLKHWEKSANTLLSV